MKLSLRILLLFTALSLSACSDANVLVNSLLSSKSSSNTPGFSTDTANGVLTGGGMTLKARVSSLSASTLTGGGMTFKQGVVK